MTSPTPIAGNRSMAATPNASDGTASAEIPPNAAIPSASPLSTSDIHRLGSGGAGATDQSQTHNGAGPADRKIAGRHRRPGIAHCPRLKGDPTAAYEIGLRFAEGKGITPNLDEAAKWYDRAAQAGVVLAVFRLGTFYEKGLSVKKDIDIARRYYMQAAERGNAKAMHIFSGRARCRRRRQGRQLKDGRNVSASGRSAGRGQPITSASSMPAASASNRTWPNRSNGSAGGGAGRRGTRSEKRDDIAKRLDSQSLAAAKLAIQNFTARTAARDASTWRALSAVGRSAGAGRRGKARCQAGLPNAPTAKSESFTPSEGARRAGVKKRFKRISLVLLWSNSVMQGRGT